MPASAYALLFLTTSVVLGIAAVARRSRRLGAVAAGVFVLFLACTGTLVVGAMNG